MCSKVLAKYASLVITQNSIDLPTCSGGSRIFFMVGAILLIIIVLNY